jgi:hypothetical protein
MHHRVIQDARRIMRSTFWNGAYGGATEGHLKRPGFCHGFLPLTGFHCDLPCRLPEGAEERVQSASRGFDLLGSLRPEAD